MKHNPEPSPRRSDFLRTRAEERREQRAEDERKAADAQREAEQEPPCTPST